MFQFSSLRFNATRVANFFFRRTAWFFSVVTACNLNTEILHTIKNKPFKETWTWPSLIERIVNFRQLKICRDRFPNPILFSSDKPSCNIPQFRRSYMYTSIRMEYSLLKTSLWTSVLKSSLKNLAKIFLRFSLFVNAHL